MPNEATHLSLATHNQEVMDYLIGSDQDLSDWVAVLAFYKALHLVEAVLFRFSQTNQTKHGRDHEHRERSLKTENRFKNIYKHYRPLKSASMVARYLQSDNQSRGSRQYKKFADYLTREEVTEKLIDHRLCQIEKSVSKLLGKKDPKPRKPTKR